MELLTRNLQYLSGHQLYNLCENKKIVPTKSWLQMTSMSANDLPPCPGDFDAKYGSTRIALLDSIFKLQPISLHEIGFSKFWKVKNNLANFPKIHFFYFSQQIFGLLKKRHISYRTHQDEPVLKTSAWYVKKWLTCRIRHFVLLFRYVSTYIHTWYGKMLITQVHT